MSKGLPKWLPDKYHAKLNNKGELVSCHEVRSLRQAFGLTQEEFSVLLRVDCTTVSDWERGKYQPRWPQNHMLYELAVGICTIRYNVSQKEPPLCVNIGIA